MLLSPVVYACKCKTIEEARTFKKDRIWLILRFKKDRGTANHNFLEYGVVVNEIRYATVVVKGKELSLLKRWGYRSITSFLHKMVGHRHASYLLRIAKIVQVLRPWVSEKKLRELGVTKAEKLAAAVARAGKVCDPSFIQELVDKFLIKKSSTRELELMIQRKICKRAPEPKLTYAFRLSFSVKRRLENLRSILRGDQGNNFDTDDALRHLLDFHDLYQGCRCCVNPS